MATLYGEELRGFRQSGDIDLCIDASKEKEMDSTNLLTVTKTKTFMLETIKKEGSGIW